MALSNQQLLEQLNRIKQSALGIQSQLNQMSPATQVPQQLSTNLQSGSNQLANIQSQLPRTAAITPVIPSSVNYNPPIAPASAAIQSNPIIAQSIPQLNQQAISELQGLMAGNKGTTQYFDKNSAGQIVYAGSGQIVPSNVLSQYQQQGSSESSQSSQTDLLSQLLNSQSAFQTKNQKTYQDSIDRLTTLYDQLSKANVPSATLQAVNNQIDVLGRQLDQSRIGPGRYFGDNPFLANIGITQPQLEARNIESSEPIARSLADLLYSRSKLGQEQQNQVANIQSQINLTKNQFDMQRALQQLTPQPLDQFKQIMDLQQLFQPKVIQTNYDEATGRYTQLVQSPAGTLNTRIINSPELAPGLNPIEYKNVLELATKYPLAGIKIGQPENTDSINTAIKKVARAYPNIEKVGEGSDQKITEEVQKQDALDQQTIGSAYGRIKSIIQKDPRLFTEQDAKKLSDIEVEGIGKALARMQQPDIARQGVDTGNALSPTSGVEKIKQFFRAWIGGKKYLPIKIVDAVKTAIEIKQGGETVSSNIYKSTNTGSIYNLPH